MVGGSLALLLVVPALPLLARGGQPIISASTLQELAGLAAIIDRPEKTLIVTIHGTEWWTAWLLRTRVAHANALEVADWSRYDVLFLEVKGGLQGPFGAPPPGGPPSGRDPLFKLELPADAIVLHEGDCLKLGRAKPPTL